MTDRRPSRATISPRSHATVGIDRTKLRLLVLALLVVGAFVVLFSRLWYLQVLASQDYRELANDNKVRRIQSEPFRGRIVDRKGRVLVENRASVALTVDRQVIDTPEEERTVLRRISQLIAVPVRDLRTRLHDATVSPYKPVAVATDVPQAAATRVFGNREDFPGVYVEKLPVRHYPQGSLAAHIFGWVGEISEEHLDSAQFKRARPRYQPGDLVGHAGLEYVYDRYLRGRPREEIVVVNSRSEVVDREEVREGRVGRDLILGLDLDLQRVTEQALRNGIAAARAAHYQAPSGGVVVMDPRAGEIRAMASFPNYDPAILADGISAKEWGRLGAATPSNTDDKLVNRTIQGAFQPGSTFKVVTAGAALASGVYGAYDQIACPPGYYFGRLWRNWSSANYGAIGLAKSLEISCDTFYYELGVRLERAFGAELGDGTEKFQRYIRTAGFGHTTGIDLPDEQPGRVPDEKWCRQVQRLYGWCSDGWLGGYTVNMSIGQGDLLVTPLQMAVTYGAIANGGKVMRPRLATAIGRESAIRGKRVTRRFNPKVLRRLPLEPAELAEIERGLVDVISGSQGTGAYAFSGFPLNRFRIAGKTGTAQIGSLDSGLNYAWFVSYGPVPDPRYVIAVYIERAGHGGESAAPVARQVWEHIAGVDRRAGVRLARDASG